ncbi:hypothetical protein [Kitasatospora sp. NRRL B-11411]|uniref:hypothetical protein n=1 Tax=Kitasatospora sp. NRRL B-11411 TaxID=1463822 RepID=UPI0004C33ECC|nr:hypothetical protein [Kitasatospora sp. NRRL B-11411]
MTDLEDSSAHPQYAGYGVNVGHAVYGDVHIHTVASVAGPERHRPEAAAPIPAPRNAALRAAVRSLVRACERTAAALSSIGRTPVGEEER